MVWIKLLICVVVVLYAGMKLARYADAIAEKTGLGRLWIGLILVASITSMPELVTGISSAALVGVPDLTLGTILGSCFFNLSILALLDILYRKTPLLSKASKGHILSAGFCILLLAIVAVSVMAGEDFAGWSIGWLGVPCILLVVFYLIGARQVYLMEKKKEIIPLQVEPQVYEDTTMKMVVIKFSLAAAAVIGAGIWLSFIGDELSTTYGWSASFVGSLFLAVTTSLPELVVTITAVRIGAIDMAVADILGANMLDVMGITWTDIFYTEGPILFQAREVVSQTHVYTALIAIAMTVTVILGLVFRREKKTFRVASWYAPILLGLYVFGSFLLFHSGIST